VSQKILRRYTELPALIHLLTTRKLTLLDPQSWDDRNDSYYLKLYRDRKKLKSVLALCFTEDEETYHHWRVFAQGSGGVCIHFKRPELLKAFEALSGIRADIVKYVTLEQGSKRRMAVQDLPFRKRWAFKHEREFRIVYESASTPSETFDVEIPLSCIARITLSPWLPHELAPEVTRMLKTIAGRSNLNIIRSSLISNRQWRGFGDAAR